jgi:hypothetical protein
MGCCGHLSVASHSRPVSQVSPTRPPAGRVPDAKSSTHTGERRRDGATEEFDLERASANGAGRKSRANLSAGVSFVRPCQPHEDELGRAGWRHGVSRTFSSPPGPVVLGCSSCLFPSLSAAHLAVTARRNFDGDVVPIGERQRPTTRLPGSPFLAGRQLRVSSYEQASAKIV